MTITYKDAVAKISLDLGIPGLSTYTQDWASELPEEYRTPAWIERYLATCARSDYGVQEKQALMDLVLNCINDMVEVGDEAVDRLWAETEGALRDAAAIYRDVVEDWAEEEDGLDGEQPIASRLRRLRAPRPKR